MEEAPAMSDNAATLTAELIVDGAVPRDPVISPDGRRVAYAVSAFGTTEPPLSALWVAAAASQISTPVLILHGQDDTNVPLSQSIYFHRALLRCSVDHEFVVYPREGHGTAERNHQLDVLRRTRAWFDRWLRDPVPDQGTS
jgi:pimeloyl-ACP methyl ester carboxylesterase